VIDGTSQIHYRAFVNTLQHVIPCAVCKEHLKETLAKFPVDTHLATRMDFFRWTVDLHNLVNKQLGKTEMTFADAESKWKSICANESTKTAVDDKKIGGTGIIIVIIAIVITGVWVRQKLAAS